MRCSFYTGHKPLRPKAELKDQHLHLLYCRSLACFCTAMVTKNTHHLTSSRQDTFFTSSFSFHGHLLTLHHPYSNYMKLWAGRSQEKLILVSINEELGHALASHEIAILQPFCTLTRAVGCWYCCFYGLSFDIALRLGQYTENGRQQVASEHKT